MDVMTPEGDEKRECLGVRIDATLVTKLNLADFQNAVPMLRELSISNASQEDARDLELRIESIPPFVRPKLWHLDSAGVWLKSEEFSTTVVDDVTALRKRVKLKKLLLFETTLATQRPAPSFSYAAQHAAQQIAQENEEAFELAVDIRRARLQRIKPLASAESPAATPITDQTQVAEPTFDEGPDLPDDDAQAEPDAATLNPKDRLARWQRKLLDLSLRNNLLNFKSGKKAMKLEAPDASALEDLLAEGQALKLLARPDLT